MKGRELFRCLGFLLAALLPALSIPIQAEDTNDLKSQLEQLRQQNLLMQRQLDQQQQMIDQLSRKLNDLQPPAPSTSATAAATPPSQTANPPADEAPSPENKFSLSNVRLSGEGGLAFFESGQNGYYPNAQFRVDEARLFLDAPIWKDVYFYGAVDLLTREAEDDHIHLEEIYLDFEDVAQFWNQEHLFNIRAGQMFIPFGEEYEVRYAMENPLISHSLSDLWGYSPGLEFYGEAGQFNYAVAVQEGAYSVVEANEADKMVSGRLGWDPASWLHLSASGLRTGNLNSVEDYWSALWFSENFFESIGSKKTTLFHADLAEMDAQVKWPRSWFKGAAGYADYNDNDPAADHHRDLYYYYTELRQGLTDNFYMAARLSQIDAPAGYAIQANNMDDLSTKDIWRLSLGAGYQFSRHLLLKAEYSLEHGQLTDGGPRRHEDLLAAECAFKF